MSFGEAILYILKAGPAGGRLRRPSSAGNDTTRATGPTAASTRLPSAQAGNLRPDAPRTLRRTRGRAMTVSQDWEARLRRMPTYHLVQFATLTRHFVSEVQRRWATGKPVPARCTRQWIDDLDAQATAAERLIATRINNLHPPT